MTRLQEMSRWLRVMLLFLLVFAQAVPAVAFAEQAEKAGKDPEGAQIDYVAATNGWIKVAFSKELEKAPKARDFSITTQINGGTSSEAEIDSLRYEEQELAAYLKIAPVQPKDKKQTVVISVDYQGLKKSAKAFTIGAAGVAAGVKAGQLVSPDVSETTGDIIGVVYDYNGVDPMVPLAGVTVTVDGTDISVVSDAEGKYKISDLPPGYYYLDYHGGAVDRQDLLDMDCMVYAGQTTEAFPAYMAPFSSIIYGSVIDETGKGIPEAKVTITHDDFTRSMLTDGEGNFRFNDLPQASWPDTYTYSVEVTKTGYPTKLTTAKPYLGRAAHVEYILLYDDPSTTTGSIFGRVKGSNGIETYDLPGIPVSLEGTDISTVSGEKGFFFIQNVPPGSYKLYYNGQPAEHSGYVTLPNEITAGETAVVYTVHLNPDTGIIIGEVVDENGQPLADATVTLRGNQNAHTDSVTTDVYGTYRFNKVPQDPLYSDMTYTIRASKPDYTEGLLYEVNPRMGYAITAETITLTSSAHFATVTGTVKGSFDGNVYPLQGVSVSVMKDGSYIDRDGRTDEQGNFTIQNIPEGDYQISYYASNTGHADYDSWTYHLTAGQITQVDEVIVPLVTGTVTGIVKNEAGAPLKDVRVAIMDNGMHRDAVTDADGRFTFTNVRQSTEGTSLTYTIQANWIGYETTRVSVTPVIGGTVEVPITLPISNTPVFNQNQGGKGGYLAGAYQLTSYQPTVHNWTRQSSVSLNRFVSQKWKHQLEGATTSQAVQASSTIIDRFGTIYLSATNTYTLYAINPDGTQKWKFKGSGFIKDPAIGADGTIYVPTSNGYLYAVNPNGTLKWSYKTQGYSHTAPVIGADGTIYIGSTSGNLYALNPNGTLKWKSLVVDATTTLNAPYRGMAIGTDGTIYAAINTKLFALTPTGTAKWSYTTGGALSGVALDATGTIYTGSYDNYMYAINANGTLKWRYYTANDINTSAAIGSDGTIYFGSNDMSIYALNPNGTKKWSYKTGGAIYSTPIIDANNGIWFGSADSKLYRMTNTGTVDATFTLGGRTWSSPAIGSYSRLYIAADDNAVYSFGY
ncbi:carboxypeptidase regulatory-like domain-containing protein [Brevibacillus dissolubilis]|uniref:carboxypeptidase regulatory-like domain-containing protein n=1 Tax=Brevibacillus dissolubilis TaxID=1844116 RepID=UPI00159BE975|nr:carboxypeptidase regulatory-like domain-containing protein [Brevibacillus dissolubilis]